MIELCNRLYKAGLKPISGQEALHPETYKVFVNYKAYCDITYMPTNINIRSRFITIEKMNLIHPWFMMIDYFRMFSDPITSFWRLEKSFERYKLIEKYYPLPLIKKPINLQPYKNKEISETINSLFDFLSEKNTVLFTGFYAYNYYFHESNYSKNNNEFKYEFMPYLEIYSTSYIKDGIDVIEFINNLPKKIASKLTYKEFYPFFQFYGYNFVIYYEDGTDMIPILYMYSNNKRCIPFKNVKLVKFDNLKINTPIVSKSKTINIGCFDQNILHSLIILVKLRVDEDNDWNDVIYKLINGMVLFRNYYLETNKATIYDDTVFQGFVVECMGEAVLLDRERRLLNEVRKKLGKPFSYKFDPSISKIPRKYSFANSSGNEITNSFKLKLKKENLTKNLLDEIESREIDRFKTDATDTTDTTEETE
jgi:hypothetical protein